MPPELPEEKKFDPRQYMAIYIFRWKTIAVCVLWCLLVAVGYIQVVPRKYRSHFTILVWRDVALDVSRYGKDQWHNLSRYKWLLSGNELNDKTVDLLKDAYLSGFKSTDKMRLPVAATAVRGQRGMLTVSVTTVDKGYGRDYLKALWGEFSQKQKSLKRDSSSDALTILEEELLNLEREIQSAEDELVDYARLNQMDLTQAKGSVETRYLLALLSYQNQLSTEMTLLDVQFPMLKEADAGVIYDAGRLVREAGSITITPVEGTDSAMDDVATASEKLMTGWGSSQRQSKDAPEVQEWQDKKIALLALEIEEKGLLEKFEAGHPRVRAVQTRIREIEDNLQISAEIAFGRLTDRREALQIAWKALEVPIRQWKNTHSLASQKQAAYKRKALVVTRREATYRTLYSRLQDLKIAEEMKAERVKIIEDVSTDEKPVWPNIPKILLVALVMALGSGFGLSTLAHIFDNKMQTVEDVESDLGLMFLGGIPHWSRKSGSSLIRPIVLEEHSSGAVEAYRTLRTSILAELDKAGQKILLITSAESREGKTLTSLNIAVMTAKVGKKVLLVDMDLRRPRIHKSLNLDRHPGMTNALQGESCLDEVVQATTVENLHFAPGGGSCEDAAELLQSRDLVEFFSKAREEYDYIFIDTSPVLRTTDASIIASPEFCSVAFVTSVDRSPKPLVKYALDLLSNATVLGVIMNDIQMNKIGSLYYAYQYPNYAYYAYAYAYGYDYDYFYADGKKGKRHRPKASWREGVRATRKWLRNTFLPME